MAPTQQRQLLAENTQHNFKTERVATRRDTEAQHMRPTGGLAAAALFGQASGLTANFGFAYVLLPEHFFQVTVQPTYCTEHLKKKRKLLLVAKTGEHTPAGEISDPESDVQSRAAMLKQLLIA